MTDFGLSIRNYCDQIKHRQTYQKVADVVDGRKIESKQKVKQLCKRPSCLSF